MRHSLKTVGGFLLVFCFTALACTIPGTGSSDSGNAEATAVFTEDSATFSPAYSYDLEPGSTVPGSQLTYVGKNGDLYDVTINGELAQKRGGDSFIWEGIVAPGVHANYNLRLLEVLGTLRAGGVVNVTVLNPVPTALGSLPEWPNAIQYSNILLTHSVAVGETIPGTTLVYDGVSTQAGVSSARLTGLTGHPLFATGDSITWIGKLRENVAIRYTFRVAAFNENSLQLGGTAELLVNR
ncbi:MAG: hypothetical protein KC445_17950 [Anaerolineales bacterium]|nr:hypothetical protein [Anaerolineales bacterium]